MPARRSASATNARERDLLQLGDMSQYKPRHRAPAAPSATWDVLDDERVPTLPDLPLSRSVTSTPVHYGGRRQNRKDRFSFSSDMDPDEWLEAQLEKLRVKKENDPEILLRKEHERRLLDELKNIHEDRLVQRGKDEADYSVEGTIHINYGRFLVKCLRTCFGSKSVDPVEEWRREEERIKNTRSPLLAGAGGGSRSTPTSPYVPHRTATPVGKSFTHPAAERPQLLTRHSSDALHDRRGPPVMPLYLPGKPPTPPPRERSRTPPSPRRQSPVRNSSTLPSYEQAVNKRRPTTPPLEGFSAPAAPGGHVSRRDMSLPTSSSRTEVNFDNLESLLWDVESPLRPSGPENVKQERRNVSNSSPAGENLRQQGVVLVSQSPKSILKKPKSTGSAGSDFNRIESSPVHNGPIRGGVDNSVVPNGPIRGRGSSARSGGVRSPDPSPVVGEREFVVQKAQTLERSTGYTEVDVHASANRPETPAFPVRKTETPLPYHPLLYDGAEFDPRSPGQPRTPIGRYQETRPSTAPIIQARSPSPGSMYYGQSRRSSLTSLEPMEVIHHHPVFVKDTSKYWYKPTISREEAINVLKEKAPGTFIVRDSNSFPGAFGLALKVATPPPGVQAKSGDGTELVRHFLIEPSAKGVKLKGCNNEPVFGSLSALVYQHSITPLALPCKLILPEFDPAVSTLDHRQMSSAQALLEQGAACNVIYINSCDTESLTGPEAVRRVIDQAFNLLSRKQLVPTNVHFKVSAQGITVTDNTRKLFFRRHYPTNSVTFCGLDPDDRRWNHQAYETAGTTMAGNVLGQARIFGFVARKISSRTDNACHVFAEYEAEQPATAIVNFVTKVMMAPLQHQQNK